MTDRIMAIDEQGNIHETSEREWLDGYDVTDVYVRDFTKQQVVDALKAAGITQDRIDYMNEDCRVMRREVFALHPCSHVWFYPQPDGTLLAVEKGHG